jgi:hypothetical protein
MVRYYLFMMVCLLSIEAVAQLSKIDTDRPDQTESAFIVPRGWLQLELGLVKEKASSAPATLFSYTLPTLLTKYGVSDNLELRLITEYNRLGNKKRFYRDSIGLLPVQLGFKLNLVKGKGVLPRISFIGHASFNRLASKLARGGSFLAPNFRFTLQNNIADGIAIGYNVGMEWEDLHERPAYIYTFSPGFDLGENWYAYVELFGAIRKGELPEHAIDAGIAYYISDNLKLDASASIGISKAAFKNYIGAGCSIRFRTKKKNNN